MGQGKSALTMGGYTVEKETETTAVAKKDCDKFFVRKIKISTNKELITKMQIVKEIHHPHVMSTKNSFRVEDCNTYYAVMDYCEGGSLAEKIKGQSVPAKESQVLSWIVEICMGLKTLHDNDLLHKDLSPQNIFFTEFGTLCLGGFGKNQANNTSLNTAGNRVIIYLAPEVVTRAVYEAKSDIWSVGCILYELCTGQLAQLAFSAASTVSLIPKIISGPRPSLEGEWSQELCELLSDMLNRDPDSRPTASEILARPITLKCLTEKSQTTVAHLQIQLGKLRAVADNLEKVHQGATIGSLAGGVIGAAGGIVSIVGLILTPFTLGASLIVTGVGVGVSVAGGVTAGASNIKNMVNQSSDRKAVQSIIKEFEEKINAVVLWLQEISNTLEMIRRRYSSEMPAEDSNLTGENWARVGTRVGRGLGGIGELFRLLQVVNIGKIAVQASRAVRVAEVATGVLSGLFVAADIFFIAMDAKEIHHLRQKDADGQTRSEIMKFVQSIRDTADKLQGVLDELRNVIPNIPCLRNERDLQRRDVY